MEQCPLLLPIGRDAAAQQFYEAAADLATAIQQFAGNLRIEEGERQKQLDISCVDFGPSGDVSVGLSLVLFQPGAPLMSTD